MARINRDMEVHMPRTSPRFRLTLALACGLLGAPALGAQAGTVTPDAPRAPAPAADSTLHVRALPALRVTTKRRKATREGVLALMQENRRLEAELRRQDEQVEALTRRLAYLRGPVTDSVHRDIARFNAEAGDVRTRRQALEARLAAAEATMASRP